MRQRKPIMWMIHPYRIFLSRYAVVPTWNTGPSRVTISTEEVSSSVNTTLRRPMTSSVDPSPENATYSSPMSTSSRDPLSRIVASLNLEDRPPEPRWSTRFLPFNYKRFHIPGPRKHSAWAIGASS